MILDILLLLSWITFWITYFVSVFAIILFVTLVFARLSELVITFSRPFLDTINTINMTLAQVVNGRSKAVETAKVRNCDTNKVGMTMVHCISFQDMSIEGQSMGHDSSRQAMPSRPCAADYNGASYLLAGKMGATDKYPVNLSMALSAASSAMTLCLPSFNVSGAVPSINPS